MAEVIDEYDEDDPNNQSQLSMMEAKKENTPALLVMSDSEENYEARDST